VGREVVAAVNRLASAPHGIERGLAGLVALAGVLVLPGTFARYVAAGTPRFEGLVQGFWLLKATLLLLAVCVWVAPVLVRRLAWAANPAPSVSATDVRWLAGVLAVATVLRLVQLDAGLWLDEIYTLVREVRPDLRQSLTTYASQNNHVLYTLLAHLAWSWGGEQDWLVRLPAVLFGVASLGATFWLGVTVAGRREAWLTTALLAVAYHHVWFSQNARGYTALLFFSVVGTCLMHRILTGTAARPVREMWLYALCMGLGVYTTLTAVFVAAGHLLAVAMPQADTDAQVARGRRTVAVGALFLAGLVTLALMSPLVPQIAAQVSEPPLGSADVEWKSPLWMLRETVRGLAQGASRGALMVGAAVVVLLCGVVDYVRRSALAAVLMLGPILVTLGGILIMGRNLWPRFFFFAAAFFVLFAFRGGHVLSRLVFRHWGDRVALAGAVLVVLGASALVPRAWGPKQDYLAAVRAVDGARRPGDTVVTLDIAALALSLYAPIGEARQVTALAELSAIEAASNRTLVVYTFPVRARTLIPDVMARVESDAYSELKHIPATVGDGEIVIKVHQRAIPPV
jgi:hypothetical protein